MGSDTAGRGLPFVPAPTSYHRPFPILEFNIMSMGVAWKELRSEDPQKLTDRGEPLHWTAASSNLGAVSDQLPLRISVEENCTMSHQLLPMTFV